MKRILLSAAAFALSISLWAQAPQGFNYQGVVKNKVGEIISEQEVSLRISLLENNAEGNSVYTEQHKVTTTENGLFTVVIGKGEVLSGNFASISWGDRNYFSKIEIDPAGGNSFENLGTSQLLSVPYAMYANQAGNSLSANDSSKWTNTGNNLVTSNTGNVGIGTGNNDPIRKLEVKGDILADSIFATRFIKVGDSSIYITQLNVGGAGRNLIYSTTQPLEINPVVAAGSDNFNVASTRQSTIINPNGGRVIIGSPTQNTFTTPTSLDVSSGNTTNMAIFSTQNPIGYMHLQSDTGNTKLTGIRVLDNGNNESGIPVRTGEITFTNERPTTLGTTNTADININTGQGQAIKIDGVSRNVGISTAAPTQKLDVNGQTRIRTILPSNSDTLLVDSAGIVKKRLAKTIGTDNQKLSISGDMLNITGPNGIGVINSILLPVGVDGKDGATGPAGPAGPVGPQGVAGVGFDQDWVLQNTGAVPNLLATPIYRSGTVKIGGPAFGPQIFPTANLEVDGRTVLGTNMTLAQFNLNSTLSVGGSTFTHGKFIVPDGYGGGFCSASNTGQGNQALYQNADGTTKLNTRNGGKIVFSEDYNEKMRLEGGRFGIFMDGRTTLDATLHVGGSGIIEGGLEVGASNNNFPENLPAYSAILAVRGNTFVYGDGFYTGTVTASGFIPPSDRRLKNNISELAYGLNEVLKLNTKQYSYKNDSLNKVHLGLIAQDIQKIIPEVVNIIDTEKQFMGVNYTELIPVLINAIKEQQAIINNQKLDLQSVKAEVAELKSLFTNTGKDHCKRLLEV